MKKLSILFLGLFLLMTGFAFAQFKEDFEIGTKGAYAGGLVTCTMGEWYMEDALIGNLANDKFNDTRSVRTRNVGYIYMNFDKTGGAGTITIWHANYGTETAGRWQLSVSTDGGTTWTPVGDEQASTATLTPLDFVVNLDGNVRVRIDCTHGTTARLNFDDITITDYSSSIADWYLY